MAPARPHRGPAFPAPVSIVGFVPAASLTLRDRIGEGRRLRSHCPRDAQAALPDFAADRDPVAMLIAADRWRIADLLPIRYARMAESPLAYLRGSAAVMAADLAGTMASGIRVQSGGDCHLANFGMHLTPERQAVFDIVDFDETLPAPFEWDLKRLATSIQLAGLEAGLSAARSARIQRRAVRAYREQMRELAPLDPQQAWRTHVAMAPMLAGLRHAGLQQRETERLARLVDGRADEAAAKPRWQDFPQLVADSGRGWRIRDNPPLIFHFDGAHSLEARSVVARYRDSLPADRQALFDHYRLVDIAFKLVGIGSVGSFCAVGLFLTADGHPLFLQIKEAVPSVLAPFAGASAFPHQGQRVVTGQRLMQAAADPFLGWAEDAVGGRHFYLRQWKDRRLAVLGDRLQAKALRFYAELCGRSLACAHARSGDAGLLAGYLGQAESFDHAIAGFAADYAEQTIRDHRALCAARHDGRLPAGDGTVMPEGPTL